MNIATVVVPDAALRAGVVTYEDETGHETLRSMRTQHRETHAVTRRYKNIVCLPRTPDGPQIGDREEEFNLRQHLGLAGALLREALIDRLHHLTRVVVGHRPINFLARNDYDLLRAAFPSGVETPPWMALLPSYQVDVRLFFFADSPPFLGLALDTRTKRRITAPCSQLVAAGIDLGGLYVGRRDAGDDPRVEPRLRLAGRVTGVAGDHLELDDTRDSIRSIATTEAHLEPSSQSFRVILDQLFGNRSEAVRDALFHESARRRIGPAKLDELRKILGYLSREPIEVSPGIELSVGDFLGGDALPRIVQAPKPVFVLSPTGAKTDTWADRGLKRYGPYSQQTFSKNRPRIAVVCQASAKGRVEQFLEKFFRGQSHPSKPDDGPFDNGLVGKYHLEGVAPSFFLATDRSADAYERAAREAIESLSPSEHWNMALIQIEESFRELAGAANPYLVTKYEFMTHQTPVQEFTLETAGLAERQLPYVLNNMALATYAKLGGTPWLLQCDRAIAHELVIGIGSADVGEGRLGDRERVVGFTTVFSGDGNYRLTNKSKEVRGNEYRQELLATLKRTVKAVSTEMNWQRGDHVRLIVHSAFKRFRDSEADAVKNLMACLGEYDVEFAFLEVSDHHPYLIFDKGQPGAPDYESKGKKGIFAPQRGKLLSLSRSESLLVLTGPRDVKRPEDGLPSPVLLRLHRESTFTDMTYLARQVCAFASHSWRSFFPGSIPVTIQYSNLIASLLGKLSRLPNWHGSVVLGRIGTSRWFL